MTLLVKNADAVFKRMQRLCYKTKQTSLLVQLLLYLILNIFSGMSWPVCEWGKQNYVYKLFFFCFTLIVGCYQTAAKNYIRVFFFFLLGRLSFN